MGLLGTIGCRLIMTGLMRHPFLIQPYSQCHNLSDSHDLMSHTTEWVIRIATHITYPTVWRFTLGFRRAERGGNQVFVF
jgi:hypothetical protein